MESGLLKNHIVEDDDQTILDMSGFQVLELVETDPEWESGDIFEDGVVCQWYAAPQEDADLGEGCSRALPWWLE